jgi:hypothetical protein
MAARPRLVRVRRSGNLALYFSFFEKRCFIYTMLSRSLRIWNEDGRQKFYRPTACSVGWWLMAGAGLF